MSELPRCDHTFTPLWDESPTLRCTDQARYMLVPMLCVAPAVKYACMAHLAQVLDKMGDVYMPILVRRLPDE